MSDLFFDVVGTVGVALGLSAYFLLQAGKLRSEQLLYSLMNLAGATLIGISLLNKWNFAAFVLEAAWALISIYGIFQWYRRRRTRS